jgi:hypothetical protein
MTMRASVLAFAALTALGIAGCAQPGGASAGGHSATESLPNAVASTGTPAPADPASRARADAVTAIAEKLLDKVQVPPGSTPMSAPSSGPLRGPFSWPGSDNLIDVSRLWKTSGSMESVLAYLQAHAPSGLTLSGGGSGGSDATASLQYTGLAPGPLDQGAELLITAAPDSAGGVGIRADVQDIWRPVRTSAETVPASVTSATIVRKTNQFMSPPAPTTTTLNVKAATAQHIADLLNQLMPEASFMSAGPGPSTVMTVAFDVGGAPLVFTTNDVQALVTVTAGGADQPMLGGADDLLTYLDGLFGVVDSPAPVDTSPPPSLPPIHFACPPPGWSPLTATPEELQKYGFPPRPTGSPGIDKAWVDAMSHVTIPTCPPSTAPSPASS